MDIHLPQPSAWIAPLASSPAASAPLWTLEGWRAADPVMGLALLMIVALLAGEALHRFTRLPRSIGPMLVGALASPVALRLVERTELDPFKPLVDLAVGVLVFELGARIRPRWLVDNPGLAAKSMVESLLAGSAVWVALVMLGADAMSAALAGVVAMSTSPAITMAVLYENPSRGQVTERLLMMTAVNSVLAVLALKVWRVVATAGMPTPGVEWLPALASGLFALAGSCLVGLLIGLALAKATPLMRSAGAPAVLQIGLIVLAAMLAVHFTLSPLLALLIAGAVARARMGHTLTVEPQLGSAGAALTVLLFLSIGVLASFDGFFVLWPWVLAFVLVRGLAKALAVFALARPSGLGWRQAAGLALALQPASGLAVLMVSSTFGWPAGFPQPQPAVLQALLIATALLQITGPWWTQLGLRQVARECGEPK